MHSDNKVGGPVRETALYFSRGVSTAEKSCTKTKTIYVWAFECATISRPNATEATRCKTAANHAYHT